MAVVTRRSSLRILCACFFLSGATGLVYEVVWLRMLGLVFGHTVYAITTVLAAFMAGLGLGSVLFGRRAARFADPVRAYGVLEIGIGLYCALLPVLLGLAASLYPHLYRLLGSSYAAFSFVQFVLVAALLVVPTTLMGGTLPLLTQAIVKRDSVIGQTVGTLYAVNTLGAVIGVALAGYLLLPTLGNRATLMIAAAANVSVGLLAILYSRKLRALRDEVSPRVPRGRRKPGPAEPALAAHGLERGLVVAGLGISGAVSMIYEVAWTRALALVIGSSTYAFSAMLVTFLVGIAGGAALYSWRWGSRRASALTFAVIQGGIGLGVVLILIAFDRLPELFLVTLGSASPRYVEVVQLVVSACALLVPALLIGATFPCAVAVCARTATRAGEETGRLYAVNTGGAIVGAVVTGFALVPAIGIHTSIKLGIVINLALAIALSASGSYSMATRRWLLPSAALLVAGITLFIPAWDLQVMSSGPAIHAIAYFQRAQARPLSAILHAREILFYRDGPSATVSVDREGKYISLRVNGKPDASTHPVDMQTQLMLGHLPLLLHPDAKSVLVIGLGSGVTAGAISIHPIRQVDLVEIEPAVVEAASFFTSENRDVLRDARARVVLADARNFLLTNPTRYDVIVSEPSNPWIGGVASLFSLEFFQLARERLGPGGLMAQWIQSYGILPEDLRMIVRTFRAAFPATTMWQLSAADYLLVGRAEPAPVDLTVIKARYEDNGVLRRDLERAGVLDWPGILGCFMLGTEDTARLSDGAGLNTDDRLRLEFSTPRSFYLETRASNFRTMRGFRTGDLPDLTPAARRDLERPQARYAIGATHLSRQIWDDALVQFGRALELDPSHVSALLGSGQASFRLGRAPDALSFAQKALAGEPRNVAALRLAAIASMHLSKPTQAEGYLQQASALEPNDEELRRALKNVRQSLGGKTGR